MLFFSCYHKRTKYLKILIFICTSKPILFDLYSLLRSFYQPRKDQSVELSGTGTQNMEEYHACQNLLVIVANVLGGKKLESACLSPLDVEISSLIKWERSLL